MMALGGCELNQSNQLYGEQQLPDLSGQMPAAVPTGEPGGFVRVDHSTWETTTIVVAQRQVEVNPNYSTMFAIDHTTARQRGEMATAVTALEDGGDNGNLALEGVVAPFMAALDLVASPVRMFIHAPWSTVRAPEDPPKLVEATHK